MNQAQKEKSLLIPSIADILFICVFLILAFNPEGRLLGDGDTGYHIRAGEYILDTLSIPKQDMFSFISPALPWTAHEWLSEAIMALVHSAFGLTGIVIFFAFIIAAIYYLVFKIIRPQAGNILVSVLVILLVIVSSQIHWLARPHIFSLLLTVIWYFMLDEFQYKGKNYLLIFPLIMLLWVNLHGGYITGFILIGIYIAGNLFNSVFSKNNDRPLYMRKTGLLGAVAVVCLFVSLINPYGYHILLFPFKLTLNKFIMDNVNEFLSPNFHEPIYFTYLLLLTIAVLAVSKKRLNSIELPLTIFFMYLALYSVRYVPVFAIIAAPVLTRQTDSLINRPEGNSINFLKKRSDRISAVDSRSKGHFWPFISLLLVIMFFSISGMNHKFNEESKPVAAVEFIKKAHLKGNMFNSDEFGDYVIYSAWPEYKVFMDGRSDMYGKKIMKEYFHITRLEQGFNDTIRKYRIEWIFYYTKSALTQFLLKGNDWKLIYSDRVANIFVKNTPENKSIIKKYGNVGLFVDEKEDREN